MKSQAAFVLLLSLFAVVVGEDREEEAIENEERPEGGLLAAEDLSENDTEQSTPRPESATSSPRRHKKRFRAWKCCKVPKPIDKELKSAFKECFNTTFKHDRKNHRAEHNGTRCWRKPNGCLSECIYKNAKMLTGDNKVDLHAVKLRIVAIYDEKNDADMKTLVENALANCGNSTDNIPAEQKCKSGSQEFSWCLRKQMFVNCPAKYWKDDKKCNAKKERLARKGDRKGRKRHPECPADTTEAPAAQ